MRRSTLFAFALSLYGSAPVVAFGPNGMPSRKVRPTSSRQALPSHFTELGQSVRQHAEVISVGSVPFLLSALMGREQVGVEEILCDPFAESEVCGEISVVGEEMATFLGESILFSNLLAVLSRTFAMASQFLSKSMAPEQLLGHSLLLFSSVGKLSKTFAITNKANSRELTPEEARAFKVYFEPAGLSYAEFKTLVAVSADWVTVEEGQNVVDLESEEYLYWLYKGDVDVTFENSSYKVSKERGPRLSDKEKFCRMGLVGDMKFFREHIDSSSSSKDTAASSSGSVSLFAGSHGATFMRISVPSLVDVMKHDEKLSKSIKSMIFKSMEDKAFAALA